MSIKEDEMWMQEALIEAKKGASQSEVPVGAVIVYQGEIVARAHNLVETKQSALAHAEMLCLEQAAVALKNWRLLDATLYCTLEPCPMCAGAMIHSRLKRLVWGAKDLRCGAHGSFVDLFGQQHPIHNMEVTTGVLAELCAQEMKAFFVKRREGHGKIV